MTMGAQAAGAYLWTLRKSKKMSREAAASKLNTVRSHIERMEYGTGDTLAPMYMAFIRLVGGDMDQVADLLLSDSATAKDGERQALDFLSQRQKRQLEEAANPLTPTQVAETLKRIDAIQQNVAFIKRANEGYEQMIQIYEHATNIEEALEVAPSLPINVVAQTLLFKQTMSDEDVKRIIQSIRNTIADPAKLTERAMRGLHRRMNVNDSEDQQDNESPD